MRVVVTGGSGKGGTWVVRDLREHGHDVLNVDARHDGSPPGACLVADLTDLGQTLDALSGAEAVVHFAAIPAPEIRPDGETFRINAMSTYNVFAAAERTRMRRVVWASSETVLGLPFDTPPMFAPIDETIEPRPESCYSLSKLVGETMAAQFARRTGIGFLGLRISNIMEPDDYADVPDVPGRRARSGSGTCGATWTRATWRRPSGWHSTAPVERAEICIVAAADTVMPRPSADLMAEVFPSVPLRRPVEGRETLLAIDHARRLLGYEPAYRWQDHARLMAATRRILVLECVQEVSTFNPVPSGADDFDVRTGEAFFAAHRGHETEVGGALAVFEEASVTAVPGFGAWAYSSTGPLSGEGFRVLADGFLEAVRANTEVDGIYACLHGSMVADDELT